MCLGIPGEIVEIHDDKGLRVGKVRFAGITRDVCLQYVPEAMPERGTWADLVRLSF